MSVLPTSVASTPRHRAAAEAVLGAAEADASVLGVMLLGSFAAGRADAVSDLDLLIVAADGEFERVWQRRAAFEGDALRAWDVAPTDRPVGAHKWLTPDLVLVDCLIAEPSSGVRLAPPFVVLTGPGDLADRLVRREPIPRAEVEAGDFVGDPAEWLYDALKLCVRGDPDSARRVVERFLPLRDDPRKRP
jgi:predicted nucleotidyltransferase